MSFSIDIVRSDADYIPLPEVNEIGNGRCHRDQGKSDQSNRKTTPDHGLLSNAS